MSSKSTTPPAAQSPHLSPFDVFWLRNDVPENRMVINFCFCLEKAVPLMEMNDYMKRWTTMYPRFRARAVKKGMSSYDWEPVANFDPVGMGCVIQHKLKTGTQEELDEFMNTCFNDVLPKDGFQWRMVEVNNVPWGGSMVIWRVHHWVCDGLALVHIIRSLFDVTEDAAAGQGRPEQQQPQQRRRPRKTPLQKAIKIGKLIAPILIGMGVGYALSLGLLSGFMLGMTFLVTAVYGKAIIQGIGALTGLRQWDSKTQLRAPLGGVKHASVLRGLLTVAKVRDLASACTSTYHSYFTVNDVLVGMVGGAFRRYFEQQGRNPDQIRLGCVIPMNIRGPKEPFRCENRFTLIFSKLPTHLARLQDRVTFMHQQMTDLKHGFEPLIGAMFIYGLRVLPDSLFRLAGGYVAKRASMVITNVDTGKKPLGFCGAVISDIIAWVPSANGIGIGVSFLSYRGKINVGLVADTKQVPKLAALADCFRQECASMVQELLPAPGAGQKGITAA